MFREKREDNFRRFRAISGELYTTPGASNLDVTTHSSLIIVTIIFVLYGNSSIVLRTPTNAIADHCLRHTRSIVSSHYIVYEP